MNTYKEILKYDKFVKELNRKISDRSRLPNALWNVDARQYVDGLASSELRQLVSIEARRNDGIFFTETTLAEEVIKFLDPPVAENMIVYDPACGAGNLLISIMNYVFAQKKEKKINLTCLGTDIHNPFVKASRMRLKINALISGTENNLKMSFRCKSGFSKTRFYKEATHIVVNPPFNMCEVDTSCKWASGKVNNAALFIEKIIESVNPGTSICAILPDVLRSGTRYAKWRAIVNRHCTIDKFKLFGQFDNYADVDIFAIRLTKRAVLLLKDEVTDEIDPTVKNQSKILLENFDICVGPVVDNRDAKKGISRGYIVSKGLPNWSIYKSPAIFRKHEGKSFKSPFVVIKRTSRMGDKHRAIATIIKTKSPVYVDNHLIVLIPKSGLLSDCEKLLANLKDHRTDDWLNDAIRCRHLTVKIVSKNTNMALAKRKEDTQNAKIRFSTQIIRRLGEELNPSIDQSILELVKNAYDADATSCIVELDNIKGVGGTIKISDNGIGMDDQAIINGWLVLGESSKSINKRTSFGRIPAGSKGLGRLAALRMGSIAILESIPLKDTTSKYELTLDWPKFDKAKLVDQIIIPIVKRPAPQKSGQGTTIYLKNLANKIGEREVRRLARGLILLADPFDDDPHSFKPRLIADEFKEMEKLVSQRYFDDADYHLQASVNSKGFGTASILDYKGNVLFKAKHTDLTEKSRTGKIYNTPPVSFDLWAFLLIQTTFSTRPTSLGEVKDWLNEFGGVHLYENGLRVNPYGNPGNDWLDMNLARSRNPEERPSTNTSIGIVRVKDSKGLLSQKTDRSGFIENDVFHEIKSFCHDALEWMARERLKVAEVKRRAARARAEKDSGASSTEVAKSIAKLPPGKRRVVQKAFDKYEKSHQQEIKTLKSEIQLYRTLSTAGITAADIFSRIKRQPDKSNIKFNKDD